MIGSAAAFPCDAQAPRALPTLTSAAAAILSFAMMASWFVQARPAWIVRAAASPRWYASNSTTRPRIPLAGGRRGPSAPRANPARTSKGLEAMRRSGRFNAPSSPMASLAHEEGAERIDQPSYFWWRSVIAY